MHVLEHPHHLDVQVIQPVMTIADDFVGDIFAEGKHGSKKSHGITFASALTDGDIIKSTGTSALVRIRCTYIWPNKSELESLL